MDWTAASIARRTAADWHGGQASPLCTFATTGATIGPRHDLGDLLREIDGNAALAASPADAADLRSLREHVTRVGSRGPVPGWARNASY
jgi:hypothetical protein